MIYTYKQWAQDGDFKAQPGQEIEPEVYEEMLNVVPPKSIPRKEADRIAQRHNIPVNAGFLMGEPHSSDAGGTLYHAFIYYNGRCFYGGLAHARQEAGRW